MRRVGDRRVVLGTRQRRSVGAAKGGHQRRATATSARHERPSGGQSAAVRRGTRMLRIPGRGTGGAAGAGHDAAGRAGSAPRRRENRRGQRHVAAATKRTTRRGAVRCRFGRLFWQLLGRVRERRPGGRRGGRRQAQRGRKIETIARRRVPAHAAQEIEQQGQRRQQQQDASRRRPRRSAPSRSAHATRSGAPAITSRRVIAGPRRGRN